MPKVLVFSVGLNYYDVIYDHCMASHARYAEKYGYDHVLVNRPRWATVLESVWIKVPLIIAGLKAGYDWVFFVDADCELRDRAPRVEEIETEGKSFYLGKGFSGNVNSGVIIAQNTPEALAFFEQVFAAAPIDVPEMDWGENGHIIHFAKKTDQLGVLERRWNNNADVDLDDYVRHYSAGGPMRPLYPMSTAGNITRILIRIRNKIMKLAGGQHTVPKNELVPRLQARIKRCQAIYPEFGMAEV